MGRRALNDDVTPDTRTYVHYDEHSDETHVETVHDVEPVFDHVQRFETTHYDGMSEDRGMQYLGEITPVVQLEWLKMGFDVFKATGPELMRWINRHRREYGYLFVDRAKPYAGLIVKGRR